MNYFMKTINSFKVFEIVGIGGTLTLFLFYFFQIQNRWFSYLKIFKN